MISFISKLSDGINAVMEKITIVFIIILTILTSIGVINRFVFNQPLVWQYETTVVIFAWVVFLGVGIAFKKGGHVQLDFVINATPEKYKRHLLIFIKLIVMLFLFIVVKDGIEIIKNTASQKYQTINLSTAWFYASFPVNALISLIHLLDALLKLLFVKEKAV